MKVTEDAFESYSRAGKIAKKVRREMSRVVHNGTPIIEVCEQAENLIRKEGGNPAFPCNVSVNEIAAHYTSPPGDKRSIPPYSLVKVDIGVHLDGFIADTAVTICSSPEHEYLVRAAEEALQVAVKTVRAGTSTSELGKAIQKAIKTYGCKPISNLTGHQIGRYLIHTGKSIPNVPHLVGSKIREGEVIALEPFVTVANGAGRVKNGDQKTIFRFLKRKSLSRRPARLLLNHIEATFRTLPFSERWLLGVVPEESYFAAFQELLSTRCLASYPVFVEASGEKVAQAEHTVLVLKDGCQILT
ncbi:MAG: type II methionyl aminopeptidase [Candidatus Bathyarchaeota archaeon]|nr:type II methionyl aminopeptidase [Candidatus Bathyarchaeota archaeon]